MRQRQRFATPEATSDELSASLGVTEHVKYPGRPGDSLAAERMIDPGAQLLLLEELLKCSQPGDDAVPKDGSGHVRPLVFEASGHDQQVLGELPSALYHLSALAHVLDHVHDVAEVHDGGPAAIAVRRVHRVPT